MIPKLIIGQAVIYAGNNLDILPELQSNSVDSIVCDPPYELGFMGKSWDNSGIAYSVELWQQCLRVLKPGGHLLAFGGTRTWHRLAVAIEDAGFEIRDNIAWLYGSGFPKSHNISKAIDKMQGAEREVVGETRKGLIPGQSSFVNANQMRDSADITAPATDEAKAWDGWGTALKPAHEPIVVARKPVEGTVAENVLQYGTGALNIDASRIGTDSGWSYPNGAGGNGFHGGVGRNPDGSRTEPVSSTQGRWPANIILDEYTAELLDQQSGISKDGIAGARTGKSNGYDGGWKAQPNNKLGYNGQGGASRFFYVAKANKRDRNEGLDKLQVGKAGAVYNQRPSGGLNAHLHGEDSKPTANFHPTVKPTALMQYLIRLVTPDNGTVLDPFCGSGSTGKAAILENKSFIGIELTPEYLPIIEGRLKHAYLTLDDKEEDLFG